MSSTLTPMNNTMTYEKEISKQADRRRACVELIKIISDLWYDKSTEMVLFRNQLINRNVSDIINLHEFLNALNAPDSHRLRDFHCIGAPRRDHFFTRPDEEARQIGDVQRFSLGE